MKYIIDLLLCVMFSLLLLLTGVGFDDWKYWAFYAILLGFLMNACCWDLW